MPNPILTIEDNEIETVYEYQTIYLWIMYGIIGIIGAGFFTKIHLITGVGGVLMVVFVVTVSTKYRKHGKLMNAATRKGSISICGSKWSFSNPLRVTIPKTPEN